MPFRYENPHDDRLTGTIAALMMRGPEARAAAAERIGAIQAQGATQAGNAYAGAAQNIGQLIGAIPGQIQHARRAQIQDSIGALQLRGAQQSAQDDDRLRAAYQQSGGDPAQMRAILAASGGLTLQHDQMLQSMEERDAAKHQALTSQIGLTLHDRLRLDDPTHNLLAMQDALDTAEHHKVITPEQAQQFGAMASADPSKIPDVAKSWAGMTAAGRAEIEKTITNKPGEVTTGRWDNATIGTPQPEKDTEVELAKRAAAGDPLAITALNRLKPEPRRTAEEDKAEYLGLVAKKKLGQPLTPQEHAKVQAYEQEKTLGVDKSASAAADRQAAAIFAATAQQARAQGFTESQFGRKELTEKVETPLRQAQQSAQELRDLVHAAQAGNKEAASLQALQATMSVVRANGFNRLNQAEMKLPEGAGSLWDRVVGKVGKATKGQPIDASLQKDLLDLSDLIEKGAYNRYKVSHRDVTTRYKLNDEKPIAPPSGYFSVVAPDSKTYTFPSQEALDAFKKRAGIK